MIKGAAWLIACATGGIVGANLYEHFGFFYTVVTASIHTVGHATMLNYVGSHFYEHWRQVHLRKLRERE